MIQSLQKKLALAGNSVKAMQSQRFFRTGPGEYAEGDKMLGVTVPEQRAIAQEYYKKISLREVAKLLKSAFHEERLTSLFILLYKFEKADDAERQKIYDLYLAHTKYVNNWDLVDSSAHKIVGAWLERRDRGILLDLARSNLLWERRIAMIACYWFILHEDFGDALAVAEILVDDDHDLIHKAVGWMLREIGKKDVMVEELFLNRHYKTMPRTMLRYAIERFEKERKDFYMGRG